MGPHKILVMRHAEKPDDPGDPNLSPAGVARAAKLVAWVPATFGTPDFIFAAADSKESHRPYETVKPLADSLGLSVDTTYADDEDKPLAHHLRHEHKYDKKTVLVCWHHGHIPDLMKHLKVPDGAYPAKWPSKVFDWTFVVEGEDQDVSATKTVEPF